MNFLEIVEAARTFLERNGRVSLRAFQREFSLSDDDLEELIEELVDIQGIASRDGRAVAWAGAAAAPAGSTPAPAARDPRSYTPKHIADKILQSKSALEGERKQVSVLFADVKGSMELSAQVDPERWHGILERFFEILTDGVHRFEGTVNQYTGDGIMALFGAPIAHEDHAQRACYAALHLREQLREYSDELRIGPGLNLSFRLGMNSGEVVVGKIGDDLRMDYTAQGHTVGLAQRMEQLAPADGIALSESTQKAVGGFFELRSLGTVEVKGSSHPIGVSVLEGVGSHRTRLDTARARGLSRFVGRSDESSALESALEHSMEGTGRVAAVVGEAGVGKSRLCAEFVETCRARGLAVYEAHCPAHGKTIPYLPLLELLRNLFGIAEQDGPREARQKVAGELALLDDGFADDRALVLDFLGVADTKAPPLQLDPAVRQRRLFKFLRRLIQLRTQAEPIVLLIDDLHWVDPGSDLFVAQIVEAVSATRTLLLVNFRPEYQADWTRKSWVLQLPMAPLDADALAELVRDWVGSSPSVASLPAMIGKRSSGNPFFAEEIVLTLLETGRLVGTRGAYELAKGQGDIEVPPTVQALLAARIDRLGDREKQLLYSAAVIGKEFPRPLLEAAIETRGDELDRALEALLAAELIYERAIYPVAEYAFKHPLTHEVALGSQLSGARQARHAAVAEAIEAADPDRLDEEAGLLAHHWTEAGEALRAGGWHVRAARWVRTSDLVASRRHWSVARELLVSVPNSVDRSRLLLAVYPELINTLDRLGADPAESEAVYQEGITHAQQAGDPGAEGLIEAAYCWLAQGQNDWSIVVGHGERAVELVDAAGDDATRLFARFTLGRARGWLGVWQSSVDCFDEALEIGGSDAAAELEVLGWRPYVDSLSIRGAVLSVMGRPADGLEFAERMPALQRRIGMHADVSSASCDRIWLCFALGDAERARRYTSEARREAERFGSERLIVYTLWASSVASCLGFSWQEGNEFIERARALVDATGTGREWATHFDSFQALCAAGMNEADRAAVLARRGVESARTNPLVKLPWVMSSVLRARVLRTLGAEHQGELEAQIAEALELVSSGADGWLPMVLAERAGLAHMRGDDKGMARDLADARQRWEQMGAAGWIDYSRTIEA